MPIDYLSKKKELQSKISDFLSSEKQRTVEGVEKTRGNISESQNRFLGGLNLNQNAVRPQLQRLGLRDRENLAKREYGQNRTRVNLIYENALKMAQDAGYDYNQAVDFARTKANEAQAQEFSAQQADYLRQQQLKQQDLLDVYQKRGMAQQDAYSTGTDYQSAIARILAGVGGTAASTYIMNQKIKGANQQNQPKTMTAGVGGYGTSGYDGSYGTAGVGGYGIGGR